MKNKEKYFARDNCYVNCSGHSALVILLKTNLSFSLLDIRGAIVLGDLGLKIFFSSLLVHTMGENGYVTTKIGEGGK